MPIGTDTQQKINAANEAISLLRTELETVEKKVKRIADRIDRHITAHDRAEAARRATYEKNMTKED